MKQPLFAVAEPLRLARSRRPRRCLRRALAAGCSGGEEFPQRPSGAADARCAQTVDRATVERRHAQRDPQGPRAADRPCAQPVSRVGRDVRRVGRVLRAPTRRTSRGTICTVAVPDDGFPTGGDRSGRARSGDQLRRVSAVFATGSAASPGADHRSPDLDALMSHARLQRDLTSTGLDDRLRRGARQPHRQCYIDYGLQDGANEANGIREPALHAVQPADRAAQARQPDDRRSRSLAADGTAFIRRPGRQRHQFAAARADAGVGRGDAVRADREDRTTHFRDGFGYNVYHDPGPPPTVTLAARTADIYKWAFSLVAIWSGHLDQTTA